MDTIRAIGWLQGQHLGIPPVGVCTTYFNIWPFAYEGEMLVCGFATSIPIPPLWMDGPELIILTLYICICLYILCGY